MVSGCSRSMSIVCMTVPSTRKFLSSKVRSGGESIPRCQANCGKNISRTRANAPAAVFLAGGGDESQDLRRCRHSVGEVIHCCCDAEEIKLGHQPIGRACRVFIPKTPLGFGRGRKCALRLEQTACSVTPQHRPVRNLINQMKPPPVHHCQMEGQEHQQDHRGHTLQPVTHVTSAMMFFDAQCQFFPAQRAQPEHDVDGKG